MTAWVGLTGGIGSGKSQAAAYFSELGVPILDADAVNRQIISNPHHPALQAIAQQFGQTVFDAAGILNRSLMRERIFRQPESKQQLENILYPYILHALAQQQMQYPDAVYGIIELPTLRQGSVFFRLIERVLLVTADDTLRIQRIRQRSHLSLDEIQRIMANQPSDEQRLHFSDDVLYNSGSLEQLQQAVVAQHQAYLQRYTHL